MRDITLELKICEGCGSLWVRHYGQEQPYCAGCKRKLADFPLRGHRRPRAKRSSVHNHLHIVKPQDGQEATS